MPPIATMATGRAAYEPSVMLALLLYCWARGTGSSRAIERACVEDVACRVIAGHQRPDHATIARFVERHERALAGVFGEVLTLCADAGLASVGVIAIDGTNVHANASRDRAMDYEELARAIVEEASLPTPRRPRRGGSTAATSCPRSSRRARAARAGCATRASGW